MTLILFVLVFGVIVIAHELGHFLIARANRIHVVEFAIGMGPKLFRIRGKNTEYSIRLFPIGGACVFEGEDGLNEEKGEPSEGAFPNANVWSRIATVSAGPIFNFILAFVFAMVLVGYSGSDRPVLLGTMEGYPAEEAGLQAGDMITAMNGEKVYVAREIYINMYMNQGNAMEVEYERNGQRHTTTLTPRYNEEEGRYLIGFQGYGEKVAADNLNVFKYSYYEVRYALKSTVKGLQMLVQGQNIKENVAGPVGMVQIIDEVKDAAAPYGPVAVLMNMMNIALLLSVNLGIINLLPLPALDGGRLVFLVVEAIRGKPIPPDKEGMVHFAGFVALMIFAVFVMFNDITRLIGL